MTTTSKDSTMTTPRGAWPVMLTPFHDDLSIDLEALDRYTDWLVEQGAAGLFPVALSGEMYDLTEEERLLVARRVVERAAGRVPVLASSVEFGDAAALAESVRRMAATGVDAVVLIASVLLGEGDDESLLREKVSAVIAANPGVALGIYECPLPHHAVLSLDTVAWLAQQGPFVFFKETSHDVAEMGRRVDVAASSRMRVFNAGIESLVESLDVGTAGLSGWVVNVYPELVQWLAEHGSASSPEAVRLQAALDAVERTMAPSYPASAKRLVALRSGIGFGLAGRWKPGQQVDEAELRGLIAEVSLVAGEVVGA